MGSRAAIMAGTNRKIRKAEALCLTRHLAGLLLVGTFLLSASAHAQQETEQLTFADPLVATGAGGEAEAETVELPGTAPTLTTAQQNAIAAAADDSVGGRTGSEAERMNVREGTVDGTGTGSIDDGNEPPGIRLGTFVLKPSLSQGLSYEKNKAGATSTSRTYSQTGLKGTLTSDWSRHQLTIDADGTYERNISGSGETQPEFRIGADLRLDLADDTIANITGGYTFQRENSSDPNAVAGASAQSGVHGFNGGARVTRDFGLIRGTLGVDIQREVFGSATLANGDELILSDRDNTEGTLTGRIGYELSPALIPYLEASIGRSIYDEKRDSLGFERSATTLGGRVGLEVDLGEKLRGDLGMGYKRATFDDARLAEIEVVTLDGSVSWSPQRGTDLRMGLATEIEPSTVAGQSGYVSYGTNAELTHELRDNLVARLTAAYTWRDFPAATSADQHIYQAGAGLTWNLNRYVALTGDISYELTRQASAADTAVTRAGVGLLLRR
jgi:hypothetical protein